MVGHIQTAVGVAGVVKMIFAMRRDRLPRTLHMDESSRRVDWSGGGVRLLLETRDWPRGQGPRRAGISGFGVSGTSAHGAQRPGMGRELARAFPPSAAAFAAVTAQLDGHLPRPLREVVWADAPDLVDQTRSGHRVAAARHHPARDGGDGNLRQPRADRPCQGPQRQLDVVNRVHFRYADAMKMPFGPGMFDGAFGIESLIHMPDQDGFRGPGVRRHQCQRDAGVRGAVRPRA
ncbi:hypothetical protein [Micromonospora rifamycinica]|uniref:hypothetical protein n=1 Tax=Micromonospora rifamycinica TaxID=291594 RepID=UPI0039A61958